MNRGSASSFRLHVPRRATSFEAEGPRTLALADWRDVDAYVLLGDPGSGKSESLHQEAGVTGGVFISARDFIVLGLPDADVGHTVFIDGLDEMRAGSTTGRAALDDVRSKLKALGIRRFRISCREHDWRSQSDLDSLRRVAPEGVVHELHLEPLSPEEQLLILVARPDEVPDAKAFLDQAEKLGVANLFGNPLLLDLTVRALAGNGRPDSRTGIYDQACRSLATERSLAHRDAKPPAAGATDRLLDDAGLLCAVLLLSGKASFTRVLEAHPSCIPVEELPAALVLHDPAAALASKVFAGTATGASEPRHRSIAEYLAARAIAKRLHEGLPLGRVLALMQGGDGAIVEPLRGLLGWLAVHDLANRQLLTRLDPLATILNGDVSVFSKADKLALLEALRDEAQRNQWFRHRHWVSYPFAPLASADMANELSAVLADHSPEASHQALVDCVLDALDHGESIPELEPLLASWVEDSSAWFSNRSMALAVLARSAAFDSSKGQSWLDRLHDGRLKDQDCRLAGLLLTRLFPAWVAPGEVLSYWPMPGDVGDNTMLPDFWYHDLLKRARPQDYAVLADAWLHFKPQSSRWYDGAVSRLRTGILAGALEHSGDHVTDERLLAWLSIAIDKHGSSKIDRDANGERVAQWLSARPCRMKAVLARGWRSTPPDVGTRRRYFWEAEELLHGARRPADWLHWLLQQAAEAPNDELAEYCFGRVARAVIDPPPGFDVPSMEQVEGWVEAHRQRTPQAVDWLLTLWSSPLENNWQRDDFQRRRQHEVETTAAKQARRHAIAPHLEAAIAGTAPASLMHELAGAHDGRFQDITGETPLERVQDFLVSDEDTAHAVVAGIDRVLDRADLPSADEVFSLGTTGKYHSIRPAALIAAERVHERSPEAVDQWPEPLLATLTAFSLTHGVGEPPAWYLRAASSRPAVIAPLLLRHARRALRHKGLSFHGGLWALARDPGHAALVRLVLPLLLDAFPLRASEHARRTLNGSLLAALHWLDETEASAIVRQKLENPSIDASQRICWLVAALPYAADAAQQLLDTVGTRRRRAEILGIALHDQNNADRALKRVHPTTLSCLIELLGPITHPERETGAHWVGPQHHRGDAVRALIGTLAGDLRPVAATELDRLVNLPRLKPWRDHLRYNALSQQATTREARFAHATPMSAALMLSNQAPTNRADLAALTVDHLGDLARHLRGSDTYALRHFWEASGARTPAPKSENDCRDLLLERLGPRLQPLGIAVVPERRAAAEKRADLRVEFLGTGRTLAVPIEIKKENNATLWSAWRDQLQALYTIDPAAGGYGVYLVLWFGHKPRTSPEGEVPDSAKSLEQLLIKRLDTKDRARLSVVVMDLSLSR